MPRYSTFHLSFWTTLVVATTLSAQPVAPPPKPIAKDREAHSKSKPQLTTPRVNEPNSDGQGNKVLEPSEAAEAGIVTEEAPDTTNAKVTRIETKTAMAVLRGDTVLATSIALGNQEEIILAELVADKSENEDVKAFAASMADEHREFLKKLRKYAPDATRPGYLEGFVVPPRKTDVVTTVKVEVPTLETEPPPKGPFEKRVVAKKIVTTEVNRTPASGDVFHAMQIEREMATECLVDSKELLDLKTGADFDKCYLHMQLAAHRSMKVKLAVYQRHASPELAAVLAEGQDEVQQHLAKAEDLLKALEGGSPSISVPRIRVNKIQSKVK